MDDSRGRVLQWIATALCAGAPMLAIGCSSKALVLDYPEVPIRSGYKPVTTASPPAPTIQPASHTEKTAATPASPPAQPREIPITLDVVLRLAEQHNARIALARERLHESQLTAAQGARGWLPNTYAGIGYFRHEGGIQQFDGRITHSSYGAVYPALQIQSELDIREGVFQLIDLERRVWQQKAELSQVNNEVLVEAALTYIDLLTARRGETIAADLEQYEQKLLKRSEKLAITDRGAVALVESLRAALSARQQLLARLRQQGNGASAKLVYLLGLAPGTTLQPMDLILAPIELVDVGPSASDLVTQTLRSGPGIRELEGILAMAQLALDKTEGAHNLLPSIQFNLAEGPFGAGPGASLTWDNRLDIGLQLRWNLTQLCQTEFKRSLIRSKQTQAMLSYEDLKGKLAAAVTESRDGILFGREQIGLSASQIQHASKSYQLSDDRLEERLGTPSEVLLAIRNLELAHFNYLQAIAAHNKTQVRLMMLLGSGTANVPAAPVSAPTPAPAPLTLPAPKGEAELILELPRLPRAKE
jgi:outer membrane protein TolC